MLKNCSEINVFSNVPAQGGSGSDTTGSLPNPPEPLQSENCLGNNVIDPPIYYHVVGWTFGWMVGQTDSCTDRWTDIRSLGRTEQLKTNQLSQRNPNQQIYIYVYYDFYVFPVDFMDFRCKIGFLWISESLGQF